MTMNTKNEQPSTVRWLEPSLTGAALGIGLVSLSMLVIWLLMLSFD
jgi:hypothetical protein